MLQLQRTLGNRSLRQMVAEARAAAAPSLQLEGEESRSEETSPESSTSLPNIELTPRDTSGRFALERMLQLVPSLVNPLENSDPSPFQVHFLPLDLSPRLVTEPRPPWLEPLPPEEQQASTPSLPSSATVFNGGPFRFRLIFEQPSITLPEQLREEEARYRAMGQPAAAGAVRGGGQAWRHRSGPVVGAGRRPHDQRISGKLLDHH